MNGVDAFVLAFNFGNLPLLKRKMVIHRRGAENAEVTQRLVCGVSQTPRVRD